MKSVKLMLLGIALIAFATFLCIDGDHENSAFLYVVGYFTAPAGFIICLWGFFHLKD